jgi:hypothetical protein
MKRSTIYILLILILTGCLIRLYSFNEPFENDCTQCAVTAHELLAGKTLYTEIWDHKPAGAFVTYVLAELLFGYTPLMMYMLNIMSFIIILMGVYSVTRHLVKNEWIACLAACFWTLISGDVMLEANQPNSEFFINCCQIWFFFIILTWHPKKRVILKILLGGFLVFWASFYKQIAVVFPVFICISFLLNCHKKHFKRYIIQLGFMAVTATAGWGIVFAYFMIVKRFKDFHFAFFEFNRGYAGSLLNNLLQVFSFKAMLPSYMLFLLPLMVFSLIGIIYLFRIKRKRPAALLIATFLAIIVELVLPGRFYQHYYQYWLAFLPVGAACGLSFIWSKNAAYLRKAGYIISVLLVLFYGCYEARYFASPASTWPLKKYGLYGHALIDAQNAAATINKLLKDDETFYLWGFETGLYFYSGKRPPTRVVYHWHLLQPKYQEQMSKWVISDLSKSKPEAVILSKHAFDNFKTHPVASWLAKRYVTFPGSDINKSYLFFIRKNGRIMNTQSQKTH